MAENKETAARSPLLSVKKNAFDVLDADELALADAYARDYMRYLDASKTEREAVREAVRLAEAAGFKPIGEWTDKTAPKAGDKLYKAIDEKTVFLAVVGEKPVTDGFLIAGAHVDSPRVDLKQIPLYEDGEMAFFKTHYYGGIKKYQWVTLPMALHGVVVKTDGTAVNVVIGESGDDPVFFITDLLPHLGKDQTKKTLGEAFTGENLNILIGSRPTGGEKDSDRFKLTVLEILNEKYGIMEDDFLSAELEAVPAGRAREAGFDRSFIGAYGHDDRSCAYAALRALLDAAAQNTTPGRTLICILVDKEEVGSNGLSGMRSAAFEAFAAQLAGGLEKAARAFEKSFCLSTDVCNAFDPNFPEVSEKNNAARVNHGMGIMKYTGSGGKSNSSDASAEIVAFLRRIFAEKGVIWQMGELGKVDQGGGGTIAMYMSNRNIPTIDAGVPVLCMHAPWEIVSKIDCYMTYKGIKAVYDSGN